MQKYKIKDELQHCFSNEMLNLSLTAEQWERWGVIKGALDQIDYNPHVGILSTMHSQGDQDCIELKIIIPKTIYDQNLDNVDERVFVNYIKPIIQQFFFPEPTTQDATSIQEDAEFATWLSFNYILTEDGRYKTKISGGIICTESELRETWKKNRANDNQS